MFLHGGPVQPRLDPDTALLDSDTAPGWTQTRPCLDPDTALFEVGHSPRLDSDTALFEVGHGPRLDSDTAQLWPDRGPCAVLPVEQCQEYQDGCTEPRKGQHSRRVLELKDEVNETGDQCEARDDQPGLEKVTHAQRPPGAERQPGQRSGAHPVPRV